MLNQDTSSVNSLPNELSKHNVMNTIPNLINNILNEHYSATKEKATSILKDSGSITMRINQKILLAQLLISVVTEFAEPHFVRVCLKQQQQQQSPHPSSKKIKTSSPLQSSCHSDLLSLIKFSNRAISWASSCLSRMITSSSTHIAKLDGLLAATGENDYMKLEEKMQQSLLCGFMGARSTEFGNMCTFRSRDETD